MGKRAWRQRFRLCAGFKNIPQPTLILRFRNRFMADGRNYLSGYDASEGALYVLFMTVLVHHHEAPSVLTVDNFDHSLNPTLAKALTRKLCEWISTRQDRQLLLTSHNPPGAGWSAVT